jgi:hypothetical protein
VVVVVAAVSRPSASRELRRQWEPRTARRRAAEAEAAEAEAAGAAAEAVSKPSA